MCYKIAKCFEVRFALAFSEEVSLRLLIISRGLSEKYHNGLKCGDLASRSGGSCNELHVLKIQIQKYSSWVKRGLVPDCVF